MKFLAKFGGRLRGALGIGYRYSIVVEADNEEEARLRLYDTHEHIHGLVLERLAEPALLKDQEETEDIQP